MKNLKKVLALGLALVMILGMFTIASAAETKKSATEFTDWNEVEHKDAVALAVDLGIISGKPDGSFDPKGTIDRASWAKLVYFTATGDDNADVYKDANTGMKDITNSWAAGYINYLIANDYASGDGLGNFMPEGTVSVAAGLKTMLTVLGYDANDRGYQNDTAWMGNIMTDAKRNGLMDDVDRSQTAAVNLTRENAAQIVYNALQANIVEPINGRDNGEKYVSSYKKGATLGYDVFNAIPVTATVKSVNKDGIATFENADPDFASSLKDVKASSTLVGEKATVWVKVKNAKFDDKGEMSSAGTFDKVVSTTAAKAASTADKTFTKGVDLDKLIAAADTKDDDYIGAEAEKVSYYLNGAESNKASCNTEAKKAGNEVAIFLDSDGKVTLVKVTTWTLAQATADLETRTRDKEVQIKLDGVLTGWVAADKVEGYNGLAENDVVLVNKDNLGNYTIVPADKVSGEVTGQKGLELTIAGSKYGMSAIANTTELDVLEAKDGNIVWNVKDSKGNEYDFYLDKNGTIVAYKQISGEVKKEVAYVLDSAYVTGNGSLTATKYGEAELLFTDGTTQIVNVAKWGGAKLVGADAGENEVSGANAASEMKGKLVDFSIDSKGNYELETKETDMSLATGEVSQKPEFMSGKTADSKTVFLVQKGDDQFFTYTGFKNVPKMNAEVAVGVSKDGIATYVFLKTDKFEGDGSTGLIYLKSTKFEQNGDGNKVYSVVNAEGAEVDMALTPADGVTLTADTFYVVDSIDDDDVATVKVVPSSDDYVTGESMTAKNGVIVMGEKSYEYDSETVAVMIEMDTKGEFVNSGKLALNSYKEDETSYTYSITLILDGNNVDFVYVVRSEINQTETDTNG